MVRQEQQKGSMKSLKLAQEYIKDSSLQPLHGCSQSSYLE